MPVWLPRFIDVLTRNLADRDAVRYLTWHHRKVTDLDGMRELIELGGEVLKRILRRAGHDLL